ncbi:MAG TPA: sporulation transcriptional regulator SpoIIID [Candidatus Merdivicinus excrementipullorum]|uniref:Sporulation transcriptional regulator SpoIIID n=1 Tax=Candidatus Merdivicinus excrementipullorum TaxID=2840867 RepID=A0A9D1FMS7_9FIRM|nr:sporulation transcriptional regulator SpoIIID [Candidatus Merdivicinus excrementipullorum]
MTDNMDERCIQFANFIIENHATVRATAKKFDYSKSTVHKDITERLRHTNPQLYNEVRKILDINKEERHIRGGMATKHKYELLNG